VSKQLNLMFVTKPFLRLFKS